MRQQRGVGGHYRDDRPHPLGQVTPRQRDHARVEVSPHREPVDDQPAPRTVVGLHQHADRVAAQIASCDAGHVAEHVAGHVASCDVGRDAGCDAGCDASRDAGSVAGRIAGRDAGSDAGRVAARPANDPRRGPDAALEAVTDHAGPAAHVALGHRARSRPLQSGPNVTCPDVRAIDVVQQPVPGLGHHRQRPPVRARPLRPLHLYEGIPHHPHGVRVREGDRGGQQPGLLDPVAAGHLTVAVESMDASEHRVQGNRLGPGHHHRHAGANRPLPHHQRTLAGNVGHMADRHPGHVHNGVQRPGPPRGHEQSDVACSHLSAWKGLPCHRGWLSGVTAGCDRRLCVWREATESHLPDETSVSRPAGVNIGRANPGDPSPGPARPDSRGATPGGKANEPTIGPQAPDSPFGPDLTPSGLPAPALLSACPTGHRPGPRRRGRTRTMNRYP